MVGALKWPQIGRCRGALSPRFGGDHRAISAPHSKVSTALESSVASGAMIRVEAISKRFGTTQALDGVSLGVEARRVLALPEPNGSDRPLRRTVASWWI